MSMERKQEKLPVHMITPVLEHILGARATVGGPCLRVAVASCHGF